MSSYELYKEALKKIDQTDWQQGQDLLELGDVEEAIKALLIIVPSAARSYAKAAAINSLDFDDLIAVGNLSLVEAVHSWAPGGMSLKNWCYRKISRDMGRHVGRELSFAGTHEEELPPESDDEPLDEAMSPEDSMSETLIGRAVSQNLPPNEQDIINLLYFRGLSLTEVGILKGVSKQAVSKIHQRAIKRLQSMVDTF